MAARKEPFGPAQMSGGGKALVDSEQRNVAAKTCGKASSALVKANRARTPESHNGTWSPSTQAASKAVTVAGTRHAAATTQHATRPAQSQQLTRRRQLSSPIAAAGPGVGTETGAGSASGGKGAAATTTLQQPTMQPSSRRAQQPLLLLAQATPPGRLPKSLHSLPKAPLSLPLRAHRRPHQSPAPPSNSAPPSPSIRSSSARTTANKNHSYNNFKQLPIQAAAAADSTRTTTPNTSSSATRKQPAAAPVSSYAATKNAPARQQQNKALAKLSLSAIQLDGHPSSLSTVLPQLGLSNLSLGTNTSLTSNQNFTRSFESASNQQISDKFTQPSISEDKMVDQAVIDKLEAGFAKLQASSPEQCHSLLKKYLTREVLDQLKGRKTAMGATLLDVAQSGFENLDSGVGIYAPDAESYTLFAELFNPIIEDYHGGFKPTDKHPASDFGDLDTIVNVDPTNEFVVSTRVRCGRSLQGYPFNPCLTEAQYKEMEDKVSSTLKGMDGDLAGTYYPLTGMTKETQQQLIDDHFLFKEGDRFLQAANACRYWPTGRGIYHNQDKTFLVWVNEEDHLRIISMQKGGDLKTIFGRMVRGVKAIEARVPFSRDQRLGFLTFCPTNLGTTIRASVHIKLPKLAADPNKLKEVAGKFNLQVRGTSGEHTESVGGIYDISNKRRLGLTEYQAVREMQDGILELIKIEKSL